MGKGDKPLQIGDPWPFRSSRGIVGDPCEPVWHALITAPQQEAKRAGQLKNAGVTIRYPTVTKTRHINGTKREIIQPMISQIIYAQFSYTPQWDVMRDRKIITGVFARDGQPIALTPDDVARVMGLPTEAERIEAERIEAERPRVGERAKISGGPFDGFFVDVERVAHGRVWWSYVGGLSFKGEVPEADIKRVAE